MNGKKRPMAQFRGIGPIGAPLNFIASFFLFGVLALGLASAARAQNITGTIVGTVKDTSGAVMPGVAVPLPEAGLKDEHIPTPSHHLRTSEQWTLFLQRIARLPVFGIGGIDQLERHRQPQSWIHLLMVHLLDTIRPGWLCWVVG